MRAAERASRCRPYLSSWRRGGSHRTVGARRAGGALCLLPGHAGAGRAPAAGPAAHPRPLPLPALAVAPRPPVAPRSCRQPRAARPGPAEPRPGPASLPPPRGRGRGRGRAGGAGLGPRRRLGLWESHCAAPRPAGPWSAGSARGEQLRTGLAGHSAVTGELEWDLVLPGGRTVLSLPSPRTWQAPGMGGSSAKAVVVSVAPPGLARAACLTARSAERQIPQL